MRISDWSSDVCSSDLFGFTERLSGENADAYYDRISERLQTPEFRPRALFERFNIEVIATTESPLDPLTHHQAIRDSGWTGRAVTPYRPPAPRSSGRHAHHLRAGHRARAVHQRDGAVSPPSPAPPSKTPRGGSRP